MEITIGNYEIKTDGVDGTCFTLFQNRPRISGKNAGTNRLVIIGHFPDLSKALYRLLEEKISMSSATNIQELRTDIERYHVEVLGAVKNLNQT